jgi:hypothetical protein
MDWGEIDKYNQRVDAWVEDQKAELRKRSKGDLVGESIRFQVADGYAHYLIVKERPFTVVHLDALDGYHANAATIRGYRLQDARAKVEADRRWAKMEAERAKQTEEFFKKNLGKPVHYDNGFGNFVRCTVVQVSELRRGVDANHLEIGEFALRSEELVGAWAKYDLQPKCYHVIGCRENRLFRPHIGHIYEASDRLQKKYEDPSKLEAIDFEKAKMPPKPKPPTGGELILAVAKMDGIDLGTPEGHEWLKEAIDSRGTPKFKERFWNRVMVS